MILGILCGLFLSVLLIMVSLFADRVTSFHMKDRNGRIVEVSRPGYAGLVRNLGIVLGFIGTVASLIAMFAYRNR